MIRSAFEPNRLRNLRIKAVCSNPAPPLRTCSPESRQERLRAARASNMTQYESSVLPPRWLNIAVLPQTLSAQSARRHLSAPRATTHLRTQPPENRRGRERRARQLTFARGREGPRAARFELRSSRVSGRLWPSSNLQGVPRRHGWIHFEILVQMRPQMDLKVDF